MRQKHLSGKHDQLTHGYRFGKAPTPSKARRMREQGTWGEYVRRARDRQGGLSKAEQKRAQKVEAAQGRIRKAQERYAKVLPKEQKAQAAFDRVTKQSQNAYNRWAKSNTRTSKLLGEYWELDDRIKASVPMSRMTSREKSRFMRMVSQRNKKYEQYEKSAKRTQILEEKKVAIDRKWNKARDRLDDAKADRKKQEREYLESTKSDRRLVMMEKRREAARLRAEFAKVEKTENKIMSLNKRGTKLLQRSLEVMDTDLTKAEKLEARGISMLDQATELHKQNISLKNRVYQTQKASFDPVIKQDGNPGAREGEWRVGAYQYSRLIGENPIVEKNPPSIGFMTAKDTTGTPVRDVDTGRAFFWENGSHMSRHDTGDRARSVVVHELGHSLEAIDPAVMAERKRFTNRRQKNSPQTDMATLFPNGGYREGEITKPDRFLQNYKRKDYGAYTGKLYSGNSEVISMGLQLFYDDPIGFAKSDPDFFDFTYAVVRMGM